MDGWRLFGKNCCGRISHVLCCVTPLILAVCQFLSHLSSVYSPKNDVNCIQGRIKLFGAPRQ